MIEKVRICKIFHFEMAHALPNYNGLCKNIHGHSYELHVSVEGEPNANDEASDYGMVMDFGALKKLVQVEIIEKFDHALVISKKDPIAQLSLSAKLKVVEFQPTCENLVIFFAQALQDKLPKAVVLKSLKLFETKTSYCEWSG